MVYQLRIQMLLHNPPSCPEAVQLGQGGGVITLIKDNWAMELNSKGWTDRSRIEIEID